MFSDFIWGDFTQHGGLIASTRVQPAGPEDLISSFQLLMACVLGVAFCVAIAVVIIRRRRR